MRQQIRNPIADYYVGYPIHEILVKLNLVGNPHWYIFNRGFNDQVKR